MGTDLEIGIGTEDEGNLKPAKVKVEAVELIEIETKHNKKSNKLVCTVSYPEIEDT